MPANAPVAGISKAETRTSPKRMLFLAGEKVIEERTREGNPIKESDETKRALAPSKSWCSLFDEGEHAFDEICAPGHLLLDRCFERQLIIERAEDPAI